MVGSGASGAGRTASFVSAFWSTRGAYAVNRLSVQMATLRPQGRVALSSQARDGFTLFAGAYSRLRSGRRLPCSGAAVEGLGVTALPKKAVKSARKAKGDGHLRRAEILEAAERIFVEYGYEGATIRKIADEVGVSSTALYMHFSDKNEILVEICKTGFAQLLAQNAAFASMDLDPVERVRMMLSAYIQFGLAQPNLYRLVFCTSFHGVLKSKEAEIVAVGAKVYELFSGAVEEVAQSGRLKVGDVDSAAQATWAAAHGLVALLLTRPGFQWVRSEQLSQDLLDGLLNGFVKT